MATAVSQVAVIRGELMESCHLIAAAVADAAGQLVAWAGDPGLRTYLRSSAKPLQALALFETGAAAAFGIGSAETAVACASHSGEDVHVAAVRSLLQQAGLGEELLNCGAHLPIEPATAGRLLAGGGKPIPVHCNCSGKHAGMLAVCRHMGWEIDGYWRPEHPLQQLLLANVAAMSGVPAAEIAIGVDGCGVPVHGMPLVNMATAFARLAQPSGLGATREAAARAVTDAMQAHPYLLAGKGRFNSDLGTAMGERLVAKSGADALFCIGLPHSGFGIAVKVADGGSRAVAPAAMAVLDAIGALTAPDREALSAWIRPEIRNVPGDVVGHLAAQIAVERA